MWWRALGVAVVLLCAGVAGGYAVADRSEEKPARSDVLSPVTGHDPAVPTPPVVQVVPDPDTEPLAPDQTVEPTELRLTKRGPGASVSVPVGWVEVRADPGDTWTFAPQPSVKNTYVLRVNVMLGQHVSVGVAKTARMAALESLEDDGNAQDLQFTAETDDSIQASYVDVGGYRRVTLERWLEGADGLAYLDIAVTGRVRDQVGLEDLIARVAESAVQLEALPPKESESPTQEP